MEADGAAGADFYRRFHALQASRETSDHLIKVGSLPCQRECTTDPA